MDKMSLYLDKNKKFIEKEISSYNETKLSDEERKKAFKEIIGGSDPIKKAEYASARIEKIKLDVLADLRALSFFELVPLKDDETPIITTDYSDRIKVSYVSNHGGAPTQLYVDNQNPQPVALYFLQSAKFYFPVISALTGALSVSDEKNQDSAYDIANKIDEDMWSLLRNSLGAFTAGTTYKLHPRVTSAGGFPTTNDIDLSGSVTGLQPEVFKAIFKYARKMGLQVRNIIVNSEAEDYLWDWTSVYTGGAAQAAATDAISPNMHDNILRTGTVNTLFGHTFNLVTDNSLPLDIGGSKAEVWVSFNKPAGKFFRKPSQDRTFRLLDKEADNMEGFTSRLTMGLAIPEPMRLNMLRVVYAV